MGLVVVVVEDRMVVLVIGPNAAIKGNIQVEKLRERYSDNFKI